jgi:hypothetical protein
MTPQAAFETLNRAAGIAPLAMPQFDGPEDLLATPFRVATAAAAALGWTGAAAAELWRFRGGDRQTVSVDLRAAAALTVPCSRLNGSLRMAQLPAAVPTGFYQSADRRWLHLSGAFPHLAQRTLDLLNADNSKAAVAEAVAKWNGLALEDALAFLGLAGAVVRSEEEWTRSIPGRLVTAPLVLTKVGDAPRANFTESPTPLGGLKVLDLSRAVAGPLCTRLLSSHGAEVLHAGSGRLASAEALDRLYAAGKRRTELDLAKPADAEALRRLAREAAVFVESCPAGALARLGFSPASLAHLAPGMITVSISAFGAEGPWAGRRGFEETAEAATGLAAEQGTFAAQRGAPLQPGLLPGAASATLSGILAAGGVLAALLRRLREGGSWHVQVNLAAAAVWLSSLGRIAADRVPEGYEPLTGLDQYLQSCETKDGWFEFLGPVTRMAKTPPLGGTLPEFVVPPHWASAHEEANAAEIQSA